MQCNVAQKLLKHIGKEKGFDGQQKAMGQQCLKNSCKTI